MSDKQIGIWQVKDSTLAFDHPWAKVRRDTCVLPDGSEIDDYYYWEGANFAQVFALTSDAHVVFVKQYKHGVKEIVLELPAGMIEDLESPLAAAQRELAEETGFTASEWHPLGILNVSSAKSSTHAYPFLAQNAQLTSQPHLDEHENIQVLLYPIVEVLNLISKGEIRDSNSIATCLLALEILHMTNIINLH